MKPNCDFLDDWGKNKKKQHCPWDDYVQEVTVLEYAVPALLESDFTTPVVKIESSSRMSATFALCSLHGSGFQ